MNHTYIIEARKTNCSASQYSPCDYSSTLVQSLAYLAARGINVSAVKVGDEFIDVDGYDYRIIED